jgi:hypothetical protein
MAMALSIALAGVPLNAQTPQEQKLFPDQSASWKTLSKQVPLSADGSVDVAKIRRDLEFLKNSPFPLVREQAARSEKFLNIATATTAAKRRALIQELADSASNQVASHLSGASLTGVWAASAHQDSGALTGAIRSGPSAEATFDCYLGDPEPCATEEEEAQLEAAINGANSEISYQQSQIDSACAQHGCDRANVSGPSAVGLDCGQEIMQAGSYLSGASLTTGSAWGVLAGARAVGVRLGAAVVGSLIGGVALAAVVTGIAIGYAINCLMYTVAVAGIAIGSLQSLTCIAREGRTLHGL